MKNIIIIILLYTVPTVITAQFYQFAPGTVEHNGASVQSIKFNLEPKPDLLRDKFEDWMDEEYGVDLDGRTLFIFEKDVMEAKGVIIPGVSEKQIDLYVRVDETLKNLSTMHVYASYGYNNWIDQTNDPIAYYALKNIVSTFLNDYLPDYYLNIVEESEEDIEELQEKREDWKEKLAENKEQIAEILRKNEELNQKLMLNEQKIYAAKKNLEQKNKEYKAVKNKINNK